MTTPTGTEAGDLDFDKLEALARAAEQMFTGMLWYTRFQILDGISNDESAAFISALDPETVLALIALARRAAPATSAQPDTTARTSGQEHFYTFSKPEGWINLLNPGQSWEEWTREQGAPTTKGWKVFGRAALPVQAGEAVELPPLPPHIEVGGEGWGIEDFMSWKTFTVEDMQDYARAAVVKARASLAPVSAPNSIPQGAALGHDGTVYHGIAEVWHRMEEGHALHEVLDDKGVPRADADGKVYSLVGRVGYLTKYLVAPVSAQQGAAEQHNAVECDSALRAEPASQHDASSEDYHAGWRDGMQEAQELIFSDQPATPEDEQWIFDLAAKHESRGRELFGPVTFSSTALVNFTRDVEAELASRCRAEGGDTSDKSSSEGAAKAPAAQALAVNVFTCKGKGGEYELIGYSNGAGPKRGESIVVYRDVTKPDVYYHRSVDDFRERMEWLGGRVVPIPPQAGEHDV